MNRPQASTTHLQPKVTSPGLREIPEQRSQPLLIQEWEYLWRDEFVELRSGHKITDTGWVDDITADGATMWVYLANGKGRVLIHQQDGIDVWRVDARICIDRRTPETDTPSANAGRGTTLH